MNSVLIKPTYYKNLLPVGYWDEENPPVPSPIPLPEDLKAKLVRHVQAAPKYLGYKGFARCRICEETLGTQCLTDGTYVFPQKYDHYIEAHNLRPPQAFIDHVQEYPEELLIRNEQYSQDLTSLSDDYGRYLDNPNNANCPNRLQGVCTQEKDRPNSCVIGNFTRGTGCGLRSDHFYYGSKRLREEFLQEIKKLNPSGTYKR